VNKVVYAVTFPDGSLFERWRDGTVCLTYPDGRGAGINPNGSDFVDDINGRHAVLIDGTVEDYGCTPGFWFKEGIGE